MADRRGLGGRPGAPAARGHDGAGVQGRATAAASRTSPSIAEIVSDYPDVPLILDPVLLPGRGDDIAGRRPRRRAARPAGAADDHASRRAASRCAAWRRRTPTSPRTPPPRSARRSLIQLGAEYVLVTGTHENTPQVINTLYGAQGVVREDSWDRLPGQLPRRRLHARVGHRRDARQRPRPGRSGARRAGVHVADAGRGLPPGHGAACSRPFLLGARRRRGAAAAGRGMTVPGLPRGLYAITPDDADTDRLVARVAAAIAGRRSDRAVPQQDRTPALARGAGRAPRRAVPRRRHPADRQRRRAPRLRRRCRRCAPRRRRRRPRRGARAARPASPARRLLLRPAGARRPSRVRPARTTLPSARCSRRSPSPARSARRSRFSATPQRGPDCPPWRSAALPSTMRPQRSPRARMPLR